MLTRKQLETAGVAKEVIDQIMDAHSADIGEIKGQLTTAQQEAAGLKTQLAERDTQLQGLQASTGDADALKAQIAQLTEQNAAQAAQHKQELTAMRRDAAVERALTGAKAKNLTAAKALLATFLENAEVGEDGNVVGLDKEVERLAKDDGTAFLFGTEAEPKTIIAGAVPANTPSVPPGAPPPTAKALPTLI